MSEIVYSIKNKNNFPRIIAEVISGEEVLAEYEVNLQEDISQLDIELIQQYSNSLEDVFDQIILDMKNDGLNSNSFIIRTAPITELLKIKTQCDQYIERMDIVE